MTVAQSMWRPLHARAEPRRHTFSDFVALFKEWRRRVRGRAELAALSDRELHDIGMTRYDARREIGKPFWRA
jgi:uncharacterized protein YjiS (DUF1127 family)